MTFPLGWLLDHAAAPIQYRAIIDVAKLGSRVGPAVLNLPYTDRQALTLACQAAIDGVWNASMLSIPSQRAEHYEGVGTIPAFRRLTECG